MIKLRSNLAYSLTFLFGLIGAAPNALPADITWLGGTGSWDDPTMWSGGAVPGAADIAIINGGTVAADNAVQVDGLTLAGGRWPGPGK